MLLMPSTYSEVHRKMVYIWQTVIVSISCTNVLAIPVSGMQQERSPEQQHVPQFEYDPTATWEYPASVNCDGTLFHDVLLQGVLSNSTSVTSPDEDKLESPPIKLAAHFSGSPIQYQYLVRESYTDLIVNFWDYEQWSFESAGTAFPLHRYVMAHTWFNNNGTVQKCKSIGKQPSPMASRAASLPLLLKRDWTPSTDEDFHWFPYAWYDFHQGITCQKGFYSSEFLIEQLRSIGKAALTDPANSKIRRPKANAYYTPQSLLKGYREWRFTFQLAGRHQIVIDFVESTPHDLALFGSVINYDLSGSWWVHLGDGAWEPCDMPP